MTVFGRPEVTLCCWQDVKIHFITIDCRCLVADAGLGDRSPLHIYQFSSGQSLGRLGRRGDMRNDPTEILFQSFFAGGYSEQFWHDQGCPLSYVVHPTFPPPPTAWPTLQGAPEDGFGEAVVACDMPEPYLFQSLDSCQKRFLWTYKKADLAPLPVVGLVLQARDMVDRTLKSSY